MINSQNNPRAVLCGRLSAADYRELRKQILVRDGWRCQYCGTRTGLETHHIVYRSRGGADTLDNLITLCAACHRALHEPSTGRAGSAPDHEITG